MLKFLAVVGAFAYLVSPVDIFPEVLLGPLGYLDDLGVFGLALKYVCKEAPAAMPAIVTHAAPVHVRQQSEPKPEYAEIKGLLEQLRIESRHPAIAPKPKPEWVDAEVEAIRPRKAALPAKAETPANPAAQRRTTAEIGKIAAQAAIEAFGAALTEPQPLQLHLAVQAEVMKALKTQ